MRADAEALPFRSKSADCLMSIRFLFHVDPDTRRRMLREFGRVSRRWIIADYRHKYSFRYGVWKLSRMLGLTRRPFERVSVKSMKSEFEDAGLRVVKIFAVRRWLSDKWVVLAESGHTDPDGIADQARGHAVRGPARSPRNSAKASVRWCIAPSGAAARSG